MARRTDPTAFSVETVDLDLPPLAGAFGRRLHEAGVPVTAERSAAFARALALTRPVARRRLYWTARGVFVSDRSQVRAFDAVFRRVFGSSAPAPQQPEVVEILRGDMFERRDFARKQKEAKR